MAADAAPLGELERDPAALHLIGILDREALILRARRTNAAALLLRLMVGMRDRIDGAVV